jgi:hypothetical protein
MYRTSFLTTDECSHRAQKYVITSRGSKTAGTVAKTVVRRLAVPSTNMLICKVAIGIPSVKKEKMGV